MKIISVTMAKNEADILELFVRHHLSFVDHMVIILHGESVDTTHDIARALVSEGLPLTILTSSVPTHRQSDIVSEALREQAKILDADVALLLDCDEFLCAVEGYRVRALLEDLPPNFVFLAPWRTFIPRTLSASWPDAMTHRRLQEEPGYSKVILQRSYLQPDLVVCQGAHSITIGGKHVIGMPHPGFWIAHVPIRSSKQAYQKALLSWPGERDNPDRRPDQGFHWKDLYDRASGVDSFNHADIIELAATYGCTRHDVCSALVRDSFTKYVSLS